MKYQFLMLLLVGLLVSGCQEISNDIVVAYGTKDYLSVRDMTAKKLKTLDTPLAIALNAWGHFQLGDLDLAMQGFKRVQEESSSFFHGHIGEAWVLLKYGQLEQAEKAIDRAEKWMDAHQHAVLFASRGWLSFYRGDLDGASKWFDKTEDSMHHVDFVFYGIDRTIWNTWAALPWVGRGWIALSRQQWSESEAAFKHGIEWDESCHLCYSGMVDLYQAQGRDDEALDAAVKGLSVVRHDTELVGKLNAMLTKRENPALSQRIYSELVAVSHGDPLYLANLGYAQMYMQEPVASEQTFKEGITADAGCQPCYLGLIALYHSQERWDDALNVVTQGLPAVHYKTALIDKLNTMLYGYDDPLLSQRVYLKLLKHSPDEPVFLANMGYIHMYLGDTHSSADAFKKALSHNKSEPYAISGLKLLGCDEAERPRYCL
ncbi:MAG: hypothetical protein ABW166_17490 [Sedimenticola sp.]